MLVLSRDAGESIQVGRDVRITVVRIDRDHVRIGITAPRHVPIRREELVATPRHRAEVAGLRRQVA